ncbi:MAG: hypothetical protein NWE80_02615, partial [Candidatus Bathyarchaeota archaeon]|nr:hypothetical protein [Candidatus Bathyarchaeota archaeon]
MEALSEQSNFIVKSKLKDLEDTGGIFDSNMRGLAYFRHEHTWRTPRGPIRVAKQARATDIYLESFDGNLFGEINEIPPKLVSMRLIRKFEIYNDKKEFVGVVREKPKAVGFPDWVLENVEGKLVAFMVGDREKKDYEIQTPDGEFLTRCFRDSSLDKDSYRVERRSVGGGVDLFLLLCYIVVLDLAKTGWTTRTGFTDAKIEKEHLAKRRLAEIQAAETRAAKSFPGYAYRNTVLSIVQAGLLFALATLFLAIDPSDNSFFSSLIGSFAIFRSVILFAFGIAILVTAFIIVA